MRLQLLIPALLGGLLLSGCVVEEPYATRGHYYDRGPSYHDTVYVESRSYPRYRNYGDRGYDRSDYRSGYRSDHRSDYRSRDRAYDRGDNGRSYARGGSDRSRSDLRVNPVIGARPYGRSPAAPLGVRQRQQGNNAVKVQFNGPKKEGRAKRDRD